jgi:aspartyl-tRNA(Asn)/glutamyl-tRNA(Gln) amidotransferase subunit B
VSAAGALIGSVMKEMRGQADAARVRELILERLPTADGTGADDAGR